MNHGWSYKNYIRPTESGQTVLAFYEQFHHSTSAQWRERITTGQILLDGHSTTPETQLQPGQTLVYQRSPWEEPDVPLNFSILYEDEDLWVINKPSGLPVLPGGKFLEHTVLGQLRLRYPHERLVPIHRLGRGTSGLLLLARSPQARSQLSQQMRDRQVQKIYRALVSPQIAPQEFTIRQGIGKLPYPQLQYIYGASSSGKFAESHCVVLKRSSESAVVEVNIKTGRPHQIRIHLAYHGYPLQGDPLYDVGGVPKALGKETTPIPSDCGYTLHACQLQLTHPRYQNRLQIDSPIPGSLQA